MNQKDLIKYGLLALGAYLVWKYIEDHGGLSAMFGTSTVSAGTQTPAQIAASAAAAKAASDLAAATAANDAAKIAAAHKAAADAAAAKTAADLAAKNQPPPIGTIFTDSAGNKQQWNGTGWTLIAPSTTPEPKPVVTISRMEQIQSLATQSGAGPLLTVDQWCYYAGQLGISCPDPGSIDPDLYAGAWGPGTDRTTPIAIDTFWYLITTTNPGISGLGGLGYRAVAPWLM